MHHGPDFLRNLAMVLGVAAVTTVVFQRLRQPVVFGYMLAGLIIGPHVPIPLVADEAMVHTLSELGVILLMFSLGLEFHLRRLLRTGASVVIVAVLQSSLMVWLGYEAGRLFGWSSLASLYAGAAIAISSTTIIVKAIADQKATGRFTEIVFGVLIIEDLIAILLLALLTPAGSPSSTSTLASLGMTTLRLAGVLAGLLAVGLLVVPRAIRFVIGLGRPEITLVVSIGLCFTIAVLVREIGYSVALGAFLAGALVAESGESHRIERLVEPVRDLFAAVFFVSVGMMIVPDLVVKHLGAVLAFTALVIVGKVGAVTTSAFLTGAGVRTSVQAGMSLAQIGEFSFIAAAGAASGATPPSLYPVLVAVSALTTLSTPWFIRLADPAAAWLDRRLPGPLQTFTVLYGTWIESLRSRPEASGERQRVQRTLRALGLDACVVAGLGIGASLLAPSLGARLAGATGWPPTHARAVVAGAAMTLSAPFLVGIVRTGRSLGQSLSRRAFPDPEPGRLDLAAAPRRTFVVAVQLVTVLVVGAPLVALTQPFLPPYLGLGLLLAGLATLGVLVWRSAHDLHGHVRAAAEAFVAVMGRGGAGGAPTDEAALRRAYHVLPGLGEPVPVRIAAGSPFAGRDLAEVGLRGRTGATVLAISRGAEVVLVPDGHEPLRAGDVLALAGTRDAIEAARRLLARGEEPSAESPPAPKPEGA